MRMHRVAMGWGVARERIDRPELMDMPGQEPAALAGNLADIQRVNRWLGGSWLTLRALDQLVRPLARDARLTLLDVATGSADIPAAVVGWARRQGRPVRVVAIDISPEILRLAPDQVRDDVAFVLADACRLPFADDAFDVAMCSLVLHHLGPESAEVMLREMGRVSRRGIIINDLVRSRAGYLGAWLLSRLLTRNPLTRHDAPLSVQRAYTLPEMARLARCAGLSPRRVERLPGYRVAMTAGGDR